MDKSIKIKGSEQRVLLSNLPAFRQAFVFASLMIVGGIVLAQYVNQFFIILPLMVSAGLLFSGLIGWCPMALIMQKMPWNK